MSGHAASPGLEGRVALVTGAGSIHGIGQAFVQELAARGARKVYAVDRVPAARAAEETAVEAGVLDITDPAAVAAEALRCGDVDLLISNAGVCFPSQFIGAANLDGARLEMEVNYWGALAMCRAFAPVLARNTRPGRRAAIVVVSSIYGFVNQPIVGTYSASKAASASLVQGLRAELSDRGIDVIGVYPGTVDTTMSRANPAPDKTRPRDLAATVLDRLADGAGDVFHGPDAARLMARLGQDRAAVEAEFTQQYRARLAAAAAAS